MNIDQPHNLAASVRQRLLNISKRDGEAFDLVLTRYALERLLYRLGESQYHNQFLLKGAMLWGPLVFSAITDGRRSQYWRGGLSATD